ncbi:response regulator transcription factor [Sinanaerobacter chloroacetimidivorans]|jgi:two-component system alkaline phosphatase synthesis response regulator PhoP|uniref:Stage 0 sporulation protein A homolog n=1 Tax=Sinanaerobacter chloroacetimidivorans TaxID=2818044 RepID=A0A8J8B0Z9_9FIRM|nr:response regulator transcription factor [Sinanaerobacter chloroacetimidivorans]MBR0597146.1 response regulator transcription factor [Sinanaerobacter chloroacetimidivorans]
MQKILIIEDEPNIRELVLYNLKENGYEGIGAEDGLLGLQLAHEERPDLILLDIMLPGKNGYDICRELRAEGSKTPIIMLTAKNEEIDKVLGLEFGADDYISKPFGIRELMARIKAVLRRYESNSDKDSLMIGDLAIDIERHEVRLGGKVLDLTLKEFDLLKTLAENRGRVMTRDQLLDKVWGFEYIGETRTVDVHVRYLRKKLGDEDNEGKYIQTIRGMGYKMP